MVSLEKLCYSEVAKDLTAEEAALIEEYFEPFRVDGMGNVYIIECVEDLQTVKGDMAGNNCDPAKLQRIFDAIEEELKKGISFDLILQK